MIFRVYTEKRQAFRQEASALKRHLEEQLGLRIQGELRVLHRYDVEGLSEDEWRRCLPLVFADAATDDWRSDLEEMRPAVGAAMLAMESLPGQFDQRADSAAQCVQFVLGGERPQIRCATVYLLEDGADDALLAAIRTELLNPVENRPGSLELPPTLSETVLPAADVPILHGFNRMKEEEAKEWIAEYGLAMDEADLACCRAYFRSEGRDPSLAELRVLDTYWADHCRHSTFHTILEEVKIDDGLAQASYERYRQARNKRRDDKAESLMDLATQAARELRAAGRLPHLDLSEEINACTLRIDLRLSNGKTEPWLLLFKNETHNHPTEIEPFGGAATCLGGAIRDPLSGRGYVYQAMRVTGAADPRAGRTRLLAGKLPQRSIVSRAAAGYSSYGNQVGLATGLVEEIYHPGYLAKRLECGAVVGAAPAAQVVRSEPLPGDIILLLGGKTGRDGCGGATGSSRSHDVDSGKNCGAEVQKGNAPEERKLQRLFRNAEVAPLIKRCNDFGAGGVSVAIGELADGVEIDLDKIPKKYEGLDGIELAISESQERMAVVVSPENAAAMAVAAASENLDCTAVAVVSASPRMLMRWRGRTIVDLSRDFLATNGAERRSRAHIPAARRSHFPIPWTGDLRSSFLPLVGDLNVCSRQGLIDRFDSTVGARSLLMPLGGPRGKTPAQGMAALFPRFPREEDGDIDVESRDCSVMSFGFNPAISEKDEYAGGYLAVLESVARNIATGGKMEACWLSFQEYFQRLGEDPRRWGSPLAALLGAYQAQMDLGLAAIGGKDSMSGSFEDIHVPPTLISFAVSVSDRETILSPECKRVGAPLFLLEADDRFAGNPSAAGEERPERHLPEAEAMRQVLGTAQKWIQEGRVDAAMTPTTGGIGAAICQMLLGHGLGFRFASQLEMADLFAWRYGSFIFEAAPGVTADELTGWREEAASRGLRLRLLGETLSEPLLRYGEETLPLSAIEAAYEAPLSAIYPIAAPDEAMQAGNERCDKNLDCDKTAQEDVPADGGAEMPPTGPSNGVKADVARVALLPRGLARPRVLIPVFPGTNCEDESAAAFRRVGVVPETLVLRNRSGEDIRESIAGMLASLRQSQILFIPGGFSGGDEPDGSGKFINAFFRHEQLAEAIRQLLEERDGLVGGICNGFQALVKLGLLPFGKIMNPACPSPAATGTTDGFSLHEADKRDGSLFCESGQRVRDRARGGKIAPPTLAHNKIGRHQSRIVLSRICSVQSPWLRQSAVGDIHAVAVSHGEGRFVCDAALLEQLFARGQVASQYVDPSGCPSMDIRYNPAASTAAVEGLISPCGRVFGKMGHSERMRVGTLKNIGYEVKEDGIFRSAGEYFS